MKFYISTATWNIFATECSPSTSRKPSMASRMMPVSLSIQATGAEFWTLLRLKSGFGFFVKAGLKLSCNLKPKNILDFHESKSRFGWKVKVPFYWCKERWAAFLTSLSLFPRLRIFFLSSADRSSAKGSGLQPPFYLAFNRVNSP